MSLGNQVRKNNIKIIKYPEINKMSFKTRNIKIKKPLTIKQALNCNP